MAAQALLEIAKPRVEEWATRIQHAGLFAQLNLETCRELASAGFFRALRAGETLWERGSHAYELAFVWEGALAVIRHAPGRSEAERVGYRLVTMNETIGLSNAMGCIPCSVDVRAHERSRVLLLPGEALRSLVPRHPELAFRAIAQLGDLVAALSDEIEGLHTRSLEQRVLDCIARMSIGKREIAVTHADIACRVGAKRESVSRVLQVLVQKKRVTLGRGRIIVHQ
jgi:CRP/FNR family transcriptional regulator, cyclic AMP receptor protein